MHAKSHQSCPTLLHYGLWPASSSVQGIPQARILAWIAMLSSDPGIKPRLLHLLQWQDGSLPLAPPGKPIYIYAIFTMIVCITLVLCFFQKC